MKIRTLIVDDEALARDRLRQLLQHHPEIELVGECTDGRQAVSLIEQEDPALIFLDIQIPELDGFEVLDAIDTDPMPVIVFVTAHDQFALRAFEVHAVDYLLKPFDRQRFDTALSRALERVKNRESAAHQERQSAVLTELRPPGKPLERLAVKSAGRVLLIKVADLDWIQSAHNYVELHVGEQTHLLRETMSSIEGRLPADKFVRISRSVIVNIDRIKELRPLFYGEYTVVLQNGARLTLSRRYRDKLPLLGLG